MGFMMLSVDAEPCYPQCGNRFSRAFRKIRHRDLQKCHFFHIRFLRDQGCHCVLNSFHLIKIEKILIVFPLRHGFLAIEWLSNRMWIPIADCFKRDSILSRFFSCTWFSAGLGLHSLLRALTTAMTTFRVIAWQSRLLGDSTKLCGFPSSLWSKSSFARNCKDLWRASSRSNHSTLESCMIRSCQSCVILEVLIAH